MSDHNHIHFHSEGCSKERTLQAFFRLGLVILLLCSLFSKGQSSDSVAGISSEIDQILAKGRTNIRSSMRVDEPIWNMPPYLGTLFLSEYYFELQALNITEDLHFQTKFDIAFFKAKLLKEQFKDGSWKQVINPNREEGSLDATIMNYWFLKEQGVPEDTPAMLKARKFILDKGGIEGCQVMTQYKLATFGQYEWHLLPYIPLSIFEKQFPYSWLGTYIKNYVAQWVYPHITALAYLRAHKTVYPVSHVCLSELRTSRSSYCERKSADKPPLSYFKPTKRSSDVDNVLEESIQFMGKKGAFGGYTISTMLNLMCFQDHALRYGPTDFSVLYGQTRLASLKYVETLYFENTRPYEGCLCDGRYWDTILASWGLLEAGESAIFVKTPVDFMIKTAVGAAGGIPYGQEFQYAPDIDDTSMLLMVYGKLRKLLPDYAEYFTSHINRTFEFIRRFQNKDGGFPAFQTGKNDGDFPIVKLVFYITQIDGSAEIFDPSCPDIVGHVLEGMGECNIKDLNVIANSIRYLYENRVNGLWSARWGINYIYAAGAVLPGLARVGFNINRPWIRTIIQHVIDTQQKDGGWGEDSSSYKLGRYIQGVSTASMTAWGLLALVEASPFMDVQDNIKKAVQFLINNFRSNGNTFFDQSVVGTGHRGVLDLQYDMYSLSFPLTALARAQKVLRGEWKQFIDPEVNEAWKEPKQTEM